MLVYIVFITILFSVFSTGVMSYITMATPIGPWIAPMLVLLSTLLFGLFIKNKSTYTTAVALATAGGSVGGILATAFGFSFSTLYFLDQPLFNAWLSTPGYFSVSVGLLALAAGGLGFLIANMFEERLIIEQEMPFPVGQLVYKMIAAQNQVKKAWELVIGLGTTWIFCALQNGIWFVRSIIPKCVTIIPAINIAIFRIPQIQIRFDVLPMLLAIGFVTGHVIAIPLAAGAIAKIFVIDPINLALFPSISNSDYVLAFCSGMVAIGAMMSFIDLPHLIRNLCNTIKHNKKPQHQWIQMLKKTVSGTELFVWIVVLGGFFMYFKFSFAYAIYLTVGAAVCAYQIITIAGKIGLAQLGRFATFVMVPAMILFGSNFVHLTLVATFVEICGGVATDMLFGRKMAHLAEIPKSYIRLFQLLGLIVSSCCIGIILWLLITHFGLGAEGLPVQRAQARALLINFKSFDMAVLCLGALFGLLLKYIKLNPMLVLGGILMPLNYSIGLMIGGLLTYVVKNREDWEPFWSGVFAANSIWELLKTVL